MSTVAKYGMVDVISAGTPTLCNLRPRACRNPNNRAARKTLGGFATNGVNITKLESYVIGGNFISAQFYIEIEAHPESKEFKLAYEELKFYSENIHFLGTYKAHPHRYL